MNIIDPENLLHAKLKQQQQREAVAGSMIRSAATQIYAHLVGLSAQNGHALSIGEMRDLAKQAQTVAPFIAEAYGLVEIKDIPNE